MIKDFNINDFDIYMKVKNKTLICTHSYEKVITNTAIYF